MGVNVNCEVCDEREFRYRCPRCMKKTCSLECSKEHKRKDCCSGVAYVASDYVESKALKAADTEEESNHLVQRDYNFLVNMNRQVSLLREDGRMKSRRVFATGGNSGVSKARHVVRRSVKCVLLPKGMQRSIWNKSKWDKALDTFVWSVEWVLFDRNGERWIHVSHRNKEEACIVDCVGKQVFDKCKEMYGVETQERREESFERVEEEMKTTKEERSRRLLNFGLKFYTKWFDEGSDLMMDTKRVIEINPTECIGETFKNKTVLEFPTIFIVPDFSVMRACGYNLDGQSSSNGSENSSTESSSDESSSTSDESSEEDDESDNSEPEEDSSKQIFTSSDDYNPGVSLDFLTA